MTDVRKQKTAGAFYTPAAVSHSLLSWAVQSTTDRVLDPSCGEGQFLAGHRKSVGIERDARSAQKAREIAPWALVHEGEFFEWAANTKERFECAAGNPPFIRYQTFNGDVRNRALALCKAVGARFSGLSSSWAPFLVVTASLLKPGGRMAFVVPAEIGHAPYATPLLEYLVSHFGYVNLIAIKEKLFPELSEDCWLLYASGFGRSTSVIDLSIIDRFRPSIDPPPISIRVPVDECRELWNLRLRPYLVSNGARILYQTFAHNRHSRRFGEIATISIGYVSGANEFFHLRPSTARKWGIPQSLLYPTVRNSKMLPSRLLTGSIVQGWQAADDPMLLLRLGKSENLPHTVRRYLDTDEGEKAQTTYKCRNRNPWYSVPDVQVPNFFLSYMSGRSPNLVRNGAQCSCTNSVHSVRVREHVAVSSLVQFWDSPFVQLSCELEGHPLGGGMLKVEPGEAARILLPPPKASRLFGSPVIVEALQTMREWRHYDAR